MAERPRVYKTEGVILKRRNIGEADTIFTVLSEREGKFDAVARGVRKARSRMRGHLEPLTRSRLMLAQGRSLDVFTQAETVDPYRNVREDLERTAVALSCVELVDRFTIEHAEAGAIYHLLVALLEALDEGLQATVSRHFELDLLAAAGYELQLGACTLCGGRLPAEETLLAPAAGGLVCANCRPVAGEGRLVSVAVIKVLRHARSVEIREFGALRMPPEVEAELRAALGAVVRYHLDRELNVPRYLRDVEALPG
ncbi:MAG: DNA repair protein RecO [Chloroflexi bacterium]|nr:DNA repair protein RecO [Chloroflexota bacterium]